MRWRLPLILLLGLCATGCNTPKSIKVLSTGINSNYPIFAAHYAADLDQMAKLAEATKEALGDLHLQAQRATSGLAAAKDGMVNAELRGLRQGMLLQFEQAAAGFLSTNLEARLASHYRPHIEAFTDKMKADEDRKRSAYEANLSSSLALQEYAQATLARAKFIALSQREEIGFWRQAIAKIGEERKTFESAVDAELARERPGSLSDFGSDKKRITEALAIPGIDDSSYATNLNHLIAQIASLKTNVAQFEKDLGSAVAEIDRYLQSNGHRDIFIGDFLKGAWSAVAGKIPGLSTLLKGVNLPDFAQPLLNSLDTKLKDAVANFGEKQLPNLIGKTTALVSSSMDKVDSAVTGLMADKLRKLNTPDGKVPPN